MLDRTIPPKYKDIEDISFPWPEFYALKNQMPLYILNQGMQPIVEVELIFKSGSYYEGKPGAAYFTPLMLLEGTTTKTGREIAHIIDGYGATLSIRPQVDFCSITLSTLSKHLTPLLDLFRELLLQPSFPEKSLMWLKSLKSQAIQVADKKSTPWPINYSVKPFLHQLILMGKRSLYKTSLPSNLQICVIITIQFY